MSNRPLETPAQGSPVRVLLLCHSLEIGGLETYLLRLLDYVRVSGGRDAQIHILCKSGRLGALRDDFLALGAVLWPLRQRHVNPFDWLALRRLLLAQNYDAVCDFGGTFGAVAMLAARSAAVPRRLVFFRSMGASSGLGMMRAIYRRVAGAVVLRCATTILSNSEGALREAFPAQRQLGPPRFRVVRNGLPVRADRLTVQERTVLRAQLGVATDEALILHVGRFRWEKNHSLILAVAAELQRCGVRARFVLAGGGVSEALQAQITALRLRNLVVLGERRDVAHLLDAADVFFFPSLSEGQPNALLEAIAVGLPFVAANIASIRECLPSWWADRALVAPRDVQAAASLLIAELRKPSRDDPAFRKLVDWTRSETDPTITFAAFWRELVGGA